MTPTTTLQKIERCNTCTDLKAIVHSQDAERYGRQVTLNWCQSCYERQFKQPAPKPIVVKAPIDNSELLRRVQESIEWHQKLGTPFTVAQVCDRAKIYKARLACCHKEIFALVSKAVKESKAPTLKERLESALNAAIAESKATNKRFNAATVVESAGSKHLPSNHPMYSAIWNAANESLRREFFAAIEDLKANGKNVSLYSISKHTGISVRVLSKHPDLLQYIESSQAQIEADCTQRIEQALGVLISSGKPFSITKLCKMAQADRGSVMRRPQLFSMAQQFSLKSREKQAKEDQSKREEIRTQQWKEAIAQKLDAIESGEIQMHPPYTLDAVCYCIQVSRFTVYKYGFGDRVKALVHQLKSNQTKQSA